MSRVSNWGRSAMCAMTSSGMPKSASTVRRTSRSWGSFISIDSVPFGRASVRRLSTRIASCGACAAFANAFSDSPTRIGLGFVRWKAWKFSPRRWAMWSIAAATKSTGTRFV